MLFIHNTYTYWWRLAQSNLKFNNKHSYCTYAKLQISVALMKVCTLTTCVTRTEVEIEQVSPSAMSKVPVPNVKKENEFSYFFFPKT